MRRFETCGGVIELLSVSELPDEWMQAEVAVDGERCLPFTFTRRTWLEIQSDEEKLAKFLYQFGKSVTAKCGTFLNPLHERQVEEAAYAC